MDGKVKESNEALVSCQPCNVVNYVVCFLHSLASLASSLYAHFVTFLSPDTGSIMFSINIMVVLAFGGFSLLWGAMVGVASLAFPNEYLAAFADYKRAIYGLALVVIILFSPNVLLLGLKDSGNRLL